MTGEVRLQVVQWSSPQFCQQQWDLARLETASSPPAVAGAGTTSRQADGRPVTGVRPLQLNVESRSDEVGRLLQLCPASRMITFASSETVIKLVNNIDWPALEHSGPAFGRGHQISLEIFSSNSIFACKTR